MRTTLLTPYRIQHIFVCPRLAITLYASCLITIYEIKRCALCINRSVRVWLKFFIAFDTFYRCSGGIVRWETVYAARRFRQRVGAILTARTSIRQCARIIPSIAWNTSVIFMASLFSRWTVCTYWWLGFWHLPNATFQAFIGILRRVSVSRTVQTA
jgi:hypothetical protein